MGADDDAALTRMGTTETALGAGVIRGGRLKITRFPALESLRDGPVDIAVTRRRATRSAVQNNFWWGVVVALLSEHTGFSPDEMHDVLKAKFLPRRLAVTDGNGEIVNEFVVGGSTTRLSTLEFGELIERVRQWAADYLGVLIPEPNEP